MFIADIVVAVARLNSTRSEKAKRWDGERMTHAPGGTDQFPAPPWSIRFDVRLVLRPDRVHEVGVEQLDVEYLPERSISPHRRSCGVKADKTTCRSAEAASPVWRNWVKTLEEYGEAFSGMGWLPVVGPWIERGKEAVQHRPKVAYRLPIAFVAYCFSFSRIHPISPCP